MDHGAVKNYCMWAHDELMAQSAQKQADYQQRAYEFFMSAVKIRYCQVQGISYGAESFDTLCVGDFAQDYYLIERLIQDIALDDWREGIRIVGWMHQYFMTSSKDDVFANYRRGKKANKETIARATQLFTPDWIVDYLVDNSLGRLWLSYNSASSLRDYMPFYVPPCEVEESCAQSFDGADDLCVYIHERALFNTGACNPKDLKIVDPACGSGHILVAVFDLLVRIYQERGYDKADIANLIFKHNITGFEIDSQVASLAEFALVMKACEVDPDFLSRPHERPRIICLTPLTLSTKEAADLEDRCSSAAYHIVNDYLAHDDTRTEEVALKYQELSSAKFKKWINQEIQGLFESAAHLDECGSLFAPTRFQEDILTWVCLRVEDTALRNRLNMLLEQVKVLREKHHVVIANPPYMGSFNMGAWLLSWMKRYYAQSYRDLCAAFVQRGFTLTCRQGYSAMVTMHSWMFIDSFRDMRQSLLSHHALLGMAHLGARAFGSIGGEVVQTTAVIFGTYQRSHKESYVRLVDFDSEELKKNKFLQALRNPHCPWLYHASAQTFMDIPGMPFVYWASESLIDLFKQPYILNDVAVQRTRISTCDNKRFMRLWHEVSLNEKGRFKRWVDCPKGGSFRKWYGNNDYVLDWDEDGRELRNSKRAALGDTRYLFLPGLTWSSVSTYKASFRVVVPDAICDHAGPLLCVNNEADKPFVLGLLNSSLSATMLEFLAPTLNFEWWAISKIPLPRALSEADKKEINQLVEELIEDSKSDWDSSETSQDFKGNPLVMMGARL